MHGPHPIYIYIYMPLVIMVRMLVQKYINILERVFGNSEEKKYLQLKYTHTYVYRDLKSRKKFLQVHILIKTKKIKF